MKRAIITSLAFVMLISFVSVSSGCASSGGPYFQRTRDHKAHVQRNRIHNPSDYRYAKVDED